MDPKARGSTVGFLDFGRLWRVSIGICDSEYSCLNARIARVSSKDSCVTPNTLDASLSDTPALVEESAVMLDVRALAAQ